MVRHISMLSNKMRKSQNLIPKRWSRTNHWFIILVRAYWHLHSSCTSIWVFIFDQKNYVEIFHWFKVWNNSFSKPPQPRTGQRGQIEPRRPHGLHRALHAPRLPGADQALGHGREGQEGGGAWPQQDRGSAHGRSADLEPCHRHTVSLANCRHQGRMLGSWRAGGGHWKAGVRQGRLGETGSSCHRLRHQLHSWWVWNACATR